jgi:hypothetical protein
VTPRQPARGLAGRLAAVEKIRDGRRLMRTYRLPDGRTVRVSTLDALRMTMDGLRLEYSGRHDTEPPAVPEPPPVARTMAQLPPDADKSVVGDLMQRVATEWCHAYDEHRPLTFNAQEAAAC